LFPSEVFILLIAIYEEYDALFNTFGQGLKLTAEWGSSISKSFFVADLKLQWFMSIKSASRSKSFLGPN
jgi:hypothetical protein